jgi:MoxR-like ATPase
MPLTSHPLAYPTHPTNQPANQPTNHLNYPPSPLPPTAPAGLENDEYVRQINGYLPTAEVAFIDEIFKANSAILNALLTLLNERLFDNGSARLEVPLLCLVSGLAAALPGERPCRCSAR